jgi:hypothetical protein
MLTGLALFKLSYQPKASGLDTTPERLHLTDNKHATTNRPYLNCLNNLTDAASFRDSSALIPPVANGATAFKRSPSWRAAP